MYAKLLMQSVRIVSDHVETAALGWTFWPKRADNHMPSGLYRIGYLADICYAGLGRSQKMEYCAVMPHIVSRRLKLRRSNIGDDPTHLGGSSPDSLHGRLDRGLGNIKDGDVLVSLSEQVIDQSRFTATDIDDGGRPCGSGALYQFQRGLKMRTIPADRVRSLGAVDFFPMRL